MSQLVLPNKYYIVWLDAHIGEPNFCLQLKRVFFTHIDPESGQAIRLSDQDIDHILQSNSEIPVTFDGFHFTLKAFVNEAACLKYIDSIQNHRILFIASSRLGQSAVEQLIKRYSHSFTNTETNKPYDSIYIFCTDIVKAAEWATPYCQYVKIFDFEADLLTRITKDMGEEFFKHGQQLLEVNQNEAAIERLSWSKSLFMRHEQLKLPRVLEKKQQSTDGSTSAEQEKVRCTHHSSNQQPKSSPKIEEIDRLLAIADERVKQQQESDYDDNDSEMQTMWTKIISPIADHLIVCLDELFGACEQSEAKNEYKTDAHDSTPVQTNDSNSQYLVQLEHEMKTCFLNMAGGLETFHDIDECCQYITENAASKTIFLITSDSIAEKLLERLSEICGSIKKIYVLGSYISGIVGWIDAYRDQGIDLLLFDHHKNLLLRILQDISKHYLSKAESRKSHTSSSTANSALVYIEWAKEMVTRANQLAQKEFENQLNDIQKHKSETEKLIRRTDFVGDVEQQMQSCTLDEDSNSVVVIFIVGLDMKLIDLVSGFAHLITCTTSKQVVSAISAVKQQTSVIVVSSTLPSDDLLSLTQLLYYYCFLTPEESVQTPLTNYPNVAYVYSIDHLMTQLYHKLGQCYRDAALRASVEFHDRDKAKHLLEKSTQCYKLLEDDTKKTLKRYAEMLKKTDPIND